MPEVEIELPQAGGMSLDMGGPQDGKITREQDPAAVQMDQVETQETEDDTPPETEDTQVDTEGQDDVELQDLGDYSEETHEAYEQQYRDENGKLNQSALSQEYYANKEAGAEGLNEGTYQYLESLGISKEMAKSVEKSLDTNNQTQTNQSNAALIQAAGGQEALQAALDWGKDGGYDEAGRNRFNTIMKGKDEAAKQEAIEALVFRHQRAVKPAPKPRVPKRDATRNQGRGAGGSPAVQPFKSKQEWREARDAAKGNQAQMRKVAERYFVSNI